MKTINIIGAGLAGSEAAYQLAKRGFKVNLYEMRPKKTTPAHQTGLFSELVCSNSLRAISLENAVGLLKVEMEMLDSLIMEAAKETEVPAGGSLAVDRVLFSEYITNKLLKNKNISFINEEIKEIPIGPTIIATGPLTSDDLSLALKKLTDDDHLYFFDAVAPIVLEESINKDIAYLKSRYDKGEASYLNCPMNEEEYNNFYNELINAEKAEIKDFEKKIFEGCMPIEDMASRGEKTLLFGPLKPVGLKNPNTGEIPYAVVQLRQDNINKTMYNLVGFQTQLKFGEQKRIIRMIPGLEKAEIVRYGVMHRNTFINSPKLLNKYFQTKDREDLFFAGQITGVEGYVESAASGLVASINMARYLQDKPLIDFSRKTGLGALANYISSPNSNFQPMNVNFGIFENITERLKKRDRKEYYGVRSIEYLKSLLGEINE